MIDLLALSKKWSSMEFVQLEEELKNIDRRIALLQQSESKVVLNDLYIVREHLCSWIDIVRLEKF